MLEIKGISKFSCTLMSFYVQDNYKGTSIHAIFQDLIRGCNNLLKKNTETRTSSEETGWTKDFLQFCFHSTLEKNPDFWTSLSCFHRTIGCKVQDTQVYTTSTSTLLNAVSELATFMDELEILTIILKKY